jgi:hypothetical protein
MTPTACGAVDYLLEPVEVDTGTHHAVSRGEGTPDS